MCALLVDLVDFLVKLTPITAVVVAWMGLNTWKRQIKGTDKYRVASELLLAVYRVREGMKVMRSPFLEYSPVKENDGDNEEMANFNGYIAAMDKRWKHVSEPVVELSLLTLKAEVHLDKKIKQQVDALMKKVRELQVMYESYIDHKRPGSDFEFEVEWRKVLWAKPTGDNFNDEVEKIIARIEGLVRAYLR